MRDGPDGVSSWGVPARGEGPGGWACALHAGKVARHAAPIAGGRLAARRTVVATDRQEPVLAGDVLPFRISAAMARLRYGSAGRTALTTVLVVAEVDLAEARVDACVRRGAHRSPHRRRHRPAWRKRRDWLATLRTTATGRCARAPEAACKATA